MKKMLLTAGLLSLLALTLTGCSMTTRWDAEIERARLEAQALTAQAQYQSQTDIAQAQESTKRTQMWAAVLPLALLIVAGAGVASLVIWFRGRGYLAQVEAQEHRKTLMLTGQVAPPAVRQLCDQYDATATPDPTTPGAWIVATGSGRRVRMLPVSPR